MRVVYDGKGYDLASAMYRSSNASWAKLIAQTKRGPFKVAQGFAELAKLKQDAAAGDVLAELAELDEAVIVRSLTDLVFLSRVNAGESVTWEQVSEEVPFFAAWGVMAQAADDEEDGEDQADPTTARTDSARATGAASGSTVRSTISSDTSPST